MSLIHDFVVATFSKLGVPGPVDGCETLLIKDGCFFGHKLYFEGGYAVLASGGSTVDFYDDDGKLVKSVAIRKDLRSSA